MRRIMLRRFEAYSIISTLILKTFAIFDDYLSHNFISIHTEITLKNLRFSEHCEKTCEWIKININKYISHTQYFAIVDPVAQSV